jgi:prohibitin 1
MKQSIVFGSIVLLFFALFAGFRACVEKVPLGNVGVRSNLLQGGIDAEDLEPGYHVVVPGMHKLQLMDARRQVMTMMPRGAGAGPGAQAEFQLIAKDQFSIGLDITLVYSLEEGLGHVAIRKYGEEAGFREKMRQRTEKVLTEVLGQLTTEEFFDPVLRTQQAAQAMDELNKGMQAEATRDYLVAHDLLIRNVAYDLRFEQRLLEKQLLDQEKLLYESKAKMEAELEKTQTIEKQTLAKVMAIQEDMNQAIQVLQAETDAEIARINADAQFHAETVVAKAGQYNREKTALGELEKTKAQALGEKATNAAYAGLGGQLLLVKKMVENVALGDIEINTNRTNPFDVSEMLAMLGLDESILGETPVSASRDREEVSAALEAIRSRLAKDKGKTEGPRGLEVIDEVAAQVEQIPAEITQPSAVAPATEAPAP